LSSHFLNDRTIRELRSTGANLEKDDIVSHLLLMPAQYDNIVMAIKTLSIEKQTLGFIKNRLLDEEAKHTLSEKA